MSSRGTSVPGVASLGRLHPHMGARDAGAARSTLPFVTQQAKDQKILETPISPPLLTQAALHHQAQPLCQTERRLVTRLHLSDKLSKNCTCLAHLGRARARCELGAEPPWMVRAFAISRAGRRDLGRDHGQVR